jgi:predicted dehydrogenase
VERLRIAVAGVGHLGSLHAKMLAEIHDVHLAGVYDIDAEKSRKIAAEFGTRSYETLDELLAGVDAVTIASTTSTHFDVASLALAAGKHVFIEKPIT